MHISNDYRHVQVKLKLRFWNANYVGTQYGGSIYSMADAFYMLMLIKNLGPNYTVWDKSAHITYLKPGKTDLTAQFNLTDEDLDQIHSILSKVLSTEWTREIEIKDLEGSVVAKVIKTIHIRKKLKSPSPF